MLRQSSDPDATDVLAIWSDGDALARIDDSGKVTPWSGLTMAYNVPLGNELRPGTGERLDAYFDALEPKPAEVPAKPQKPLWVEGQRFRRAHRAFDPETTYYILTGTPRYDSPMMGTWGDTPHRYPTVAVFEAAIRSGELVPVDSPPPPPPVAPVEAQRADPLMESYAELGAWDRWMSEREDRYEYSPWDGLDTIEKVGIYSTMCELAGESRPWLPASRPVTSGTEGEGRTHG
jgi:hypothetical protein